MKTVADVVTALEDIVLGYSEDATDVGYVALAARREIQALLARLEAREGEIERLVDLLKRAGIEILHEP